MSTFHLIVSSLEGKLFDGDVKALYLRGADGDLAVLPGHSAFITAVQPCKCRADTTASGELSWTCLGGMLSVSASGTVLTLRVEK